VKSEISLVSPLPTSLASSLALKCFPPLGLRMVGDWQIVLLPEHNNISNYPPQLRRVARPALSACLIAASIIHIFLHMDRDIHIQITIIHILIHVDLRVQIRFHVDHHLYVQLRIRRNVLLYVHFGVPVVLTDIVF
jgi:hypothetical protein